MKRNALNEIKLLDANAIEPRIIKIREEIAEDAVEMKMNKMKDLKTIYKKRKDLAQMLTVLRQKQMLKEIEVSEDITKKGETSKLSSNA